MTATDTERLIPLLTPFAAAYDQTPNDWTLVGVMSDYAREHNDEQLAGFLVVVRECQMCPSFGKEEASMWDDVHSLWPNPFRRFGQIFVPDVKDNDRPSNALWCLYCGWQFLSTDRRQECLQLLPQ